MTSPPPAQPVETAEPADDNALLMRYLQSAEALCPDCNYNCRGLTEPRCPECGRALKLTLGIPQPYVLPWTLMIICVAMAGSVGILLGGIAGRNGLYMVKFLVRSPDIPLLLGTCYGMAAVPLLLVLVLWRRRFFQLERRRQWLLAGMAFGINALLVGWAVITH